MWLNYDPIDYTISEFFAMPMNCFYPEPYGVFEFYIYYLIVLNVSYMFITYLYTLQVNIFELPFLLSFLILSLLTLFLVNDLIVLYFCLELIAFLTYILLGFTYDNKDRFEGTLKYFILNSVASIFILFGISLFYLNTLETSFLKITISYLSISEINFLSVIAFITFLTGFLFKLGCFPCLIWIVDIYENLNFSVLTFLLTIHKFSFFFIFTKLLYHVFFMFNIIWMPLITISAAGSLIIGACGALVQFKLKRFIAYTSINQMGYLLFSLSTATITGVLNAFNFLTFYLVSTVIMLLLLNFYNEKFSGQLIYLTDLALLRLKMKNFSIFLFLLSVCSLANLPPLTTFFTKYFIMRELMFLSFTYSSILIFMCSLISMYYYIRLIKIFIFDLPLDYITTSRLNIVNNFHHFNNILNCFHIAFARYMNNTTIYPQDLHMNRASLSPNHISASVFINLRDTCYTFLVIIDILLLLFFFIIF